MTKELQGLYQKYQTNPLKLLMGPLANASVFIPMFFGLKKMGEFVPGEWEVS
jgi:membrane protein insertase Oxa1/YidC/SpoIIIJ